MELEFNKLGIDIDSGSWQTYFIENREEKFFNKNGERICFEIINPCNMDFSDEMAEVLELQRNLNNFQTKISEFWSREGIIEAWTNIYLKLIKEYKVSGAKVGRITSAINNVINDALVVAFHFKYLWNLKRPDRVDLNFEHDIDTPNSPTYPSSYAVLSGAMDVVLSYYFKAESEKLSKIAEEASISRLYGGINFRSDLSQGLRLGRQIGRIAIEELGKQYDKNGVSIDVSYTKFRDADIIPKY